MMTQRQPPPPGSPARNASRRANPFRSSRISPGAIDYIFPTGPPVASDSSAALEELVQKLAENRWQGAIVGPHGTGKSTLVAALRKKLEDAGKSVCVIELHDGQRKLPWLDLRAFVDTTRWQVSRGMLIVDGYEQLSKWQQARLRRYANRRHVGLVVTAHQPPAWIPPLARSDTPRNIVEAVLRRLLADHPELLPRCLELSRELIERHSGNLREVLFALYDAYEEGGLSADA